jgi:hypothetical protein
VSKQSAEFAQATAATSPPREVRDDGLLGATVSDERTTGRLRGLCAACAHAVGEHDFDGARQDVETDGEATLWVVLHCVARLTLGVCPLTVFGDRRGRQFC